jgi:hypothetical protein
LVENQALFGKVMLGRQHRNVKTKVYLFSSSFLSSVHRPFIFFSVLSLFFFCTYIQKTLKSHHLWAIDNSNSVSTWLSTNPNKGPHLLHSRFLR